MIFNVTITDAEGGICSKEMALAISDSNCFTNTSLPTADTLAHAYSAQLVPLLPATTAYVYTLVAGAFPAGISLNPITGLISGDPFGAAQATYNVTIGLTGTCCPSCLQDFTILAQCGGDMSDTPQGHSINTSSLGDTIKTSFLIQRTGAPKNLTLSIAGAGTSSESLALGVFIRVKRVSDNVSVLASGNSYLFGGPAGACKLPPYDWPIAEGPNTGPLQSCVPYYLETKVGMTNVNGFGCLVRITSVAFWT